MLSDIKINIEKPTEDLIKSVMNQCRTCTFYLSRICIMAKYVAKIPIMTAWNLRTKRNIRAISHHTWDIYILL